MGDGAWIALLRGINVSGANRVPMAELRALCAELGWGDVGTYIQSGNVVFRSVGAAAHLEEELEGAIAERFGLRIPVIVRSLPEWEGYLEGNPFPAAAAEEPNRLMLVLCKSPPRASAAAELTGRATLGESVHARGDAVWIHYPQGSGRSKVVAGVLDRALGSPATSRNWNTVQKLGQMAAEVAGGARDQR